MFAVCDAHALVLRRCSLAPATSALRVVLSRSRGRRTAPDTAPTPNAGQEQTVHLGPALQLLANDQRKQRPGRAREDEKPRSADKDRLQRLRMRDKAQADADRP